MFWWKIWNRNEWWPFNTASIKRSSNLFTSWLQFFIEKPLSTFSSSSSWPSASPFWSSSMTWMALPFPRLTLFRRLDEFDRVRDWSRDETLLFSRLSLEVDLQKKLKENYFFEDKNVFFKLFFSCVLFGYFILFFRYFLFLLHLHSIQYTELTGLNYKDLSFVSCCLLTKQFH